MNCTEFEKRLQEQFGPTRLDEAGDLAEHAHQCSACRELLEHFRVLSDCLSVWREQIPEVDLSGAVVSACQSQRELVIDRFTEAVVVTPDRRRARRSRQSDSAITAAIVARSPWLPGRFRNRRTGWLAAAAAVGLLLIAAYFSRPGGDAPRAITAEPAPKAPDVVADGSSLKDEGAEAAAPVVDRAVALPEAARDVYYDLAQKAAGAFGEVTVFVMPESSPPKMVPSDQRPEGPGGWIGGLSHQLQPIGRSLDDAFDFLWQAGEAADG
jgi:hypothetical protein